MRAGAPIQPFGAFFGSPVPFRPAGHTQGECPGRDTYRGCRPVIITGRAPDTTTVRPVPTGVELVVVGGGNMGAALVGGLLAGGRPPSSIAVTEVAPARREQLAATVPRRARVRRRAAVRRRGARRQAGRRRRGGAGGGRRRGAAAAVDRRRRHDRRTSSRRSPAWPTSRRRRAGDAEHARARRQGASAIAAGAAAGDDDLAWAERILGAVGHGRARRREPARRRHRAHRLRPGVPLPRRRGADRRRRGGRPGPELAEALDDAAARRLGALLADAAIRPRCGRWSRRPGARPPPGSPCSSRAALSAFVEAAVRAAAARSRELAAGDRRTANYARVFRT